MATGDWRIADGQTPVQSRGHPGANLMPALHNIVIVGGGAGAYPE